MKEIELDLTAEEERQLSEYAAARGLSREDAVRFMLRVELGMPLVPAWKAEKNGTKKASRTGSKLLRFGVKNA